MMDADLEDELNEFLNCPVKERLLRKVGYYLHHPMVIRDDITMDIPKVRQSLIDMTREDPRGSICNMMIDQLKEEFFDDRED